MLRRVTLAVALALAFALPADARAQPRDAPAAEVLFTRGRAAMRDGRLAEACELFAESQKLDPAPGTLINLAGCEKARGRLADAWGRYSDALATLPDGDSRLGFVRGEIASLAPRLPKLILRLSPSLSPRTTRVLRDGVQLGQAALGEPLPVNPGEHVVRVSVEGRLDREIVIALAEGETRELTLDAGDRVPAPPASTSAAPVPAPAPPAASPASPARPSPPAPAEPMRPAQRAPTGPVLLGAGASALLVGLAAGAWAIDRKATARSHCDASGACDDDGLVAVGQYRSATRVSTIAITMGLVLGGAGAYLTFAPAPGGGALSASARW